MPISAAVRRGRLFRRRSPITWRTSPDTRPRLDSAQLAPHARSSRASRAATPARPAATLAVDDAPEERARVGLRVARVWLRELSGPNGSYGAASLPAVNWSGESPDEGDFPFAPLARLPTALGDERR